MRVVFLGNAKWSVPSLEALAGSSHDLALVVTRAPRLGGRGNRPISTPVADSARRLGLPLQEIETVKSGPGFEVVAEAEPDALVVVAYGEILPKEILDLPTVAPVNVHFSLLPKLRGAAPVQRAILEGLDTTGVTTIRMDEGMDTGPILLQAEEPILPDDDAGSLGDRLADAGGRLVVATLDGLAAGSLEEHHQDHEAATYAPKFKPEHRVIDWSRSSEEVVRLVRAMSPEPGATTIFRGKRFKVLRATPWTGFSGSPLADPFGWRPGHIGFTEDGVAVVTGTGVAVLDEIQLEGRRRMSGAEFVRGYRPQVKERLGELPGAPEPSG